MSDVTKNLIAKPHLAKPWIYFLATYAWSWSFFGIAYWLGLSAETGCILGTSLVLLALSGPAIMAITFVKLTLNKKGQSDYWERIFDYKRISGKWYLAIFLLIPTIGILSAILSGYWQFLTFANVTPSLLLTAIVIPFVPLAEELGWRGFVLDRLQENYSALNSSLILGFLWGFWHLPAFFLTGGGLSVIPFASLAFWEYMGGLVALSICMTWIYNNTNRSTLSAVLFHMVLEFWADIGLFPWTRPDLAYHLAYHIGLWAIVALSITVTYGAAKLVKKDQDTISKSASDNPQNENVHSYDHAHYLGSIIQQNYTPFLNAQECTRELKSTEKNRKEITLCEDPTVAKQSTPIR